MPKFLTFKSPSSSDLKENPIKALYESFLSFDKFTKGFLIVLLLILISTPFLVNNLLIFKPHAQETEPTLGEQTPPTSPSVPGEILVKFKAGVDEKVKDNIKSAHGIEKLDEIAQIEVERGKVPEKAKDKIIEALSKNPRVEFAEPNYIFKTQLSPNDPYFVQSFQWNMKKISAPVAWDITQGNANVTVAIVDTGIDTSHPDLVGKVLNSVDFTGSTSTNDIYSHGTHVGGIVAALTNNSIGVAGLGSNLTLDNVKVLNDTGSGSSVTISNGIIWATDHGAKVINMSLGATSVTTTLQNAVNYAWNKGLVLVAAAGNTSNSTPEYPAAGQNVIAVANTQSSDQPSPSSTYGDWIDVAAPGSSIYSTITGGSYGSKSGTSMASPHVAGLAALILSANSSLTPQQVVDTITSTALDLGDPGFDIHYGWGRIQADKAVAKAAGLPFNPDNQPPKVSLTSPTSGSTVSGVIDITTDATDNVGVTKVEFYAGGYALLGSDISSPYVASLDTTKYANGSTLNLVAKAYDGAGYVTTSTTVTVTVNQTSTPDTTLPTVSITSPTDGSTISGNTNIVASASDNVGLSTISIFIDGSVVTSCSVSGTSNNCSYSLDTTQYSNGAHTIFSKALDSSSNLGQSTTVTVNVNNVISTPTSTPTPSPTLSPTPTPIPTPTADITPPIVSITNPVNGSGVKTNSQVNITANVTDNIKVSKVEFYAAGSLKCSSTLSSGPYSCNTWKVPAKKGVNYTITVKGYDSSNNTSSASISVKSQ